MHDGGVFVYQVVKAPGNLVISAYVTCPDITLTVTPDLKLPGAGRLLWVDLAGGQRRLGGSALAQAYSQARPKARDCCRVPLLSLCAGPLSSARHLPSCWHGRMDAGLW